MEYAATIALILGGTDSRRIATIYVISIMTYFKGVNNAGGHVP